MENEINFNLPLIDLNVIKGRYEISPEEEEIILGIIYNPANGAGLLRATRPKQSGVHSWVWRNVMMLVSPEEKFHNIATALDSYIEECGDTNVLEYDLNRLVDKIVGTIPPEKLYGTSNWKESMGVK